MLRLLPLLLSGCVEYNFSQQVDVSPGDITECGFTPFEDMPALSAYDCNPVFTTSGEDWVGSLGSTAFTSTQVLGHPFFQIWYEGVQSDGTWSIGYAVSENGTDWLPHPRNPYWPAQGSSDWDTHFQRPVVSWDPNLDGYTMLYGGFSDDNFFGLGVAGARDGVQWTRSPHNPLLDLTIFYEDIDLAWPVEMDIRPGQYDVYMGGNRGDTDVVDLYRIQTDNIEDLMQPAEKVFSAGSAGAWDDQGFVDATVVELDGRTYMFYVGFADWDTSGSTMSVLQSHVGLAVSDDQGGSWKRLSDEPLPLSRTSTGNINMVAAVRIGPRIHIWVDDYYPELNTSAIGYFLYEP